MASYNMNQVKVGLKIMVDGDPCIIVDADFVKPGKGQAFTKIKYKNFKTERVNELTMRSADSVEGADVHETEMQYLYNDGDLYHFMDKETYEQPALSKEAVADVEAFLIDGLELSLAMHEGRAIKIELPVTVDLEVVEAPPAHKGDTASGASKPVKLSNGMTVTVPMFIDAGTIVRIDTRTGAYVTRVSS